MAGPSKAQPCEWVTLAEALDEFVYWNTGTESKGHILKLHWHTACRLVIEGGFHPETIKPRPPFRIQRKGSRRLLHYDPNAAVGHGGEATVFGGLKTKDIDVVVTLPGIGPVIGISMKGTLKALRNLTNRLEEAAGDCTNIHIAYPGFVYGFVHILRANRWGPVPAWAGTSLKPDKNGHVKAEDLGVKANGEVTPFISNYHDAIARLTGRRDIRNDHSRYEAITLIVAGTDDSEKGSTVAKYPLTSSPLHFDQFFRSIYLQYFLRYIYGAPSLILVTRRMIWDIESPAFKYERIQAFTPRFSEEIEDASDMEPADDGEQQDSEPNAGE